MIIRIVVKNFILMALLTALLIAVCLLLGCEYIPVKNTSVGKFRSIESANRHWDADIEKARVLIHNTLDNATTSDGMKSAWHTGYNDLDVAYRVYHRRLAD